MLLLRPDHVGDVLLTAPAVARLRAALPHARLTYLVGPWSREVAAHGVPVDQVRTLAYPGFTRAANRTLLAPYGLLLREAARLRRERFDVAIVFRPDHWWGGLLAACAGIPVRVGAATPETAPLLTHVRRANAREHAAEQALGLAVVALRAVGVPSSGAGEALAFRVSAAARAWAADVWRSHHLDDRRVVAIQASAGAALKSWPTGHWAAVADRIASLNGSADQPRVRILLTGGPGDAALLEHIATRMATSPAAVLVGQSLDVTAAIFERCHLVIGLDGGAAHLAAAVGTPTIRLYGPVSPDVFGPWPRALPDQHVLSTRTLSCVPCGHLESPPCGARSLPACLLAIDVEAVAELARRHLTRG